MDEPFIRFQDLHKSFGPKVVLQGLTLDIHRGETVVVIGGSGTGKSVLLRHIVGLHRPDRGSVIVDGTDVTDLGENELMPVRRKISTDHSHLPRSHSGEGMLTSSNGVSGSSSVRASGVRASVM